MWFKSFFFLNPFKLFHCEKIKHTPIKQAVIWFLRLFIKRFQLNCFGKDKSENLLGWFIRFNEFETCWKIISPFSWAEFGWRENASSAGASQHQMCGTHTSFGPFDYTLLLAFVSGYRFNLWILGMKKVSVAKSNYLNQTGVVEANKLHFFSHYETTDEYSASANNRLIEKIYL